ncbi:MAG TPA: hypothetical protein VGN32_08290 [Ktedonobacterales bacterium]|jgi:hypothetical protein|nr:hypothetical protein [Ktedonobacterales bacterium]
MGRHLPWQGVAGDRTRGQRVTGVLFPLALVALLTLAACAPSGTPTDVASCPPVALSGATRSAATATATTPTVLYQADWSHGLAGWQATAGWTVVDGALQSDTGDARAVTVPYLPAVPDYQVEISLQIVTVPRTGGQFALQTARQACDAGYNTGVNGLRVGNIRPNGDHANIFIYLDPMDAQDSLDDRNNVHDFEPGPYVRTYQVAVRASQATLYVDGHFFSSVNSALSARLARSPIRLTCSGVAMRVSALRILAL